MAININIGHIYGSLKVTSKAKSGYNCKCVVCGARRVKKSRPIILNSGNPDIHLCFCNTIRTKFIGKVFGSIKVLNVSHQVKLKLMFRCQCLVCNRVTCNSIDALKRRKGSAKDKVCFCHGKEKKKKFKLSCRPKKFLGGEVDELLGGKLYLDGVRIIRRYLGDDVWELQLAKKEENEYVPTVRYK